MDFKKPCYSFEENLKIVMGNSITEGCCAKKNERFEVKLNLGQLPEVKLKEFISTIEPLLEPRMVKREAFHIYDRLKRMVKGYYEEGIRRYDLQEGLKTIFTRRGFYLDINDAYLDYIFGELGDDQKDRIIELRVLQVYVRNFLLMFLSECRNEIEKRQEQQDAKQSHVHSKITTE